jgi:hypothetical protein
LDRAARSEGGREGSRERLRRGGGGDIYTNILNCDNCMDTHTPHHTSHITHTLTRQGWRGTDRQTDRQTHLD